MIPKRIKLLGLAGLIIMLMVIIGSLLFNRQAPSTETIVSPTPSPVSGFSSTTNISQLEQQSGFVKVEDIDIGIKAYNYETNIPYIYNNVIEKDGETLYKVTSLLNADSTYPTLVEYLVKYGDYELRGFDRLTGLDLFVYPQAGIAIVGTEQGNQASKLIEFTPLSREDFERELQPIMFQQGHQ